MKSNILLLSFDLSDTILLVFSSSWSLLMEYRIND
jgi:hypothetical protein